MTSPVNYELIESIGVITVDYPPVNALSHAVRLGLQDSLREALDDTSEAILIVCAGRTFMAGADITEFGKPPRDPWLPELVDEIEASDKLVVAGIHGTSLGGGFEVAIACHYRCAVDSAKVGLPEVKLGLLPGAGGTQRTPRLAGVAASLDLITSGNPVSAQKAVDLGLVDQIVPGDIRDGALAFVRKLLADGAPVRRSSALEVEKFDAGIFDDYRARLTKAARGQHAPQRIVDCVEAAATLSFEKGSERERDLFMECMNDPQSAALRHLFFAEREAAKIHGLSRDTRRRDIATVGIIGAGTMGGGIAMSFANAGFPVTIVEISDDALQRGLSVVDRNYAGSVKRGKLTEEAAADCRRRISGVTAYDAVGDADLVIEAVFEDPKLKHEIFAQLDKVCKSGAILATNTSYQDVNAIAAATRRPGDVIGMHFFSPANIMKLLEIVRADKTADDVLATTMAVAKAIGKVAVVSGVCYGFIGNRMLQPYMREAQLCLIEGATPEQIDTALYEWGMAMGPLSVADLAGIDVGFKARQALPEGERGDPRSYRIADQLVENGRLGQKSGAGFYTYDPETRQKSSDPVVMEIVEREASALGIERRAIDAAEIVDRTILSLANEGFRVLEEGIAQRPGDIDVVYAYGYGFPAYRGGPMHYADTVGVDKVLARINEFRERFGAENWAPAPLLERLAAGKTSIADWSREKSA